MQPSSLSAGITTLTVGRECGMRAGRDAETRPPVSEDAAARRKRTRVVELADPERVRATSIAVEATKRTHGITKNKVTECLHCSGRIAGKASTSDGNGVSGT